jgi:hypothetical protein
MVRRMGIKQISVSRCDGKNIENTEKVAAMAEGSVSNEVEESDGAMEQRADQQFASSPRN